MYYIKSNRGKKWQRCLGSSRVSDLFIRFHGNCCGTVVTSEDCQAYQEGNPAAYALQNISTTLCKQFYYICTCKSAHTHYSVMKFAVPGNTVRNAVTREWPQTSKSVMNLIWRVHAEHLGVHSHQVLCIILIFMFIWCFLDSTYSHPNNVIKSHPEQHCGIF